MGGLRARARDTLRKALHAPAVKAAVEAIPGLRRIYSPWQRSHPFDKSHGIETSGFVPASQIHRDPTLAGMIVGYGGSQPGVVRAALQALGEIRDYTFVDVGCGKGRVAIVASEFPFKEIIGIELSNDLAEIARRNVEQIAKRFPDRPRISIHRGNALDFQLPRTNSVIYIYHPFGPELMKRFVEKLETGLGAPDAPRLLIIYCNPVAGDILDASPALRRWYADVIPYLASEIGFGPDDRDTVVIWQSARNAGPTPHERPGRKIVIIEPELRAGLADG